MDSTSKLGDYFTHIPNMFIHLFGLNLFSLNVISGDKNIISFRLQIYYSHWNGHHYDIFVSHISHPHKHWWYIAIWWRSKTTYTTLTILDINSSSNYHLNYVQFAVMGPLTKVHFAPINCQKYNNKRERIYSSKFKVYLKQTKFSNFSITLVFWIVLIRLLFLPGC